MQTPNRPNRDALRQAIDIYRDAMRPFIVRRLKQVQGATVEELIERGLGDRQADEFSRQLEQHSDIESAIDLNYFPQVFRENWSKAFAQQFNDDLSVQNMLWLIKTARDQTEHPGTQDIDTEYTRTYLYHIADLLGRINAPDQKNAVEALRDTLSADTEEAEPTAPPATAQASTAQDDRKPTTTEGDQKQAPQPRPSSKLPPWREVIRPNNDVALGTFQEAEFAADLQQVHDGRAEATGYGNPVSFFNQTYITPGIRTLLVNTLRRLGANGGAPIIQTKTGFGGGKTHSLIALYHLVKNADALINPPPDSEEHQRTSEEIKDIMQEAEWRPTPDVPRIAVLDGSFLARTDPTVTKETGDPLNTLWGMMAYQLGGMEAYELVGQAAREGTAPGGGQLDQLLEYVGPCVILMDELVAYVRNAGDAKDSIYTFMQALTQSVRRSQNAALVVTLPESVVEAGAEGGAEALSRLDSILGRIEAVWEPLEIHEAFEVVRRRLLGRVRDEAARNRVCETFVRMYTNSRKDYPEEVTEPQYLNRMKACYPIHPEIFERLYSDWSSIPRFQRTRAVLRMMATCISRLYLREDASPLIMPANLTLDDSVLANEFIPLLQGEWRPVLTEVDSDGSRTDNIDQNARRFMEIGGAARRIARTVFLGSASSGAIRGIDARRINLGVVQPGQGVSVYKEALERMDGDLYYFYCNNERYYFHAEENLNKVATDRADALSNRDVEECIVANLQEAVGVGIRRHRDVIVCPQDSGEVEDTDTVRLVILPPSKPLPTRSSETDEATATAKDIILTRGDASRIHRNTLLFLGAKSDEIRGLKNFVRTYLAWHSIINGDNRIQNLTGDRLSQAKSSLSTADTQLSKALVTAYRWALSPAQSDPQHGDYRLTHLPTNAKDTGDIVKTAFQTFIDEEALVDEIAPTALTMLLQQYVWNNENYKDHIGIDVLWNILTSTVYFHRMRNREVLIKCIKAGVQESEFGYAESYNDEEYAELCFGEPMPQPPPPDADRGSGLLVNPEMARLVKDITPPPIDPKPDPSPDPTPPRPGPQRIVVKQTNQNEISLDEIDQLRDEVIRNLNNEDNAEVTIEIIVTAHKPDGFSEKTVRTVRENSAQLGIEFSDE